MTPTPKAEMQDSVHLTESAGEASTAKPMQGLAEWLRDDALDANPRNAAKLNRWASEVEAAAAPPSDTAVSADAARYRWLRDVDSDPTGLRAMWTDESGTDEEVAAKVDAAIDAARHSADTYGPDRMNQNPEPAPLKEDVSE